MYAVHLKPTSHSAGAEGHFYQARPRRGGHSPTAPTHPPAGQGPGCYSQEAGDRARTRIYTWKLRYRKARASSQKNPVRQAESKESLPGREYRVFTYSREQEEKIRRDKGRFTRNEQNVFEENFITVARGHKEMETG